MEARRGASPNTTLPDASLPLSVELPEVEIGDALAGFLAGVRMHGFVPKVVNL